MRSMENMQRFLKQQFELHGKHELFRVWRGAMMLGEGANICEEWKDFSTFANAIGKRPYFRSFLRRRDDSLPLGPTNFYWRGNAKPDADAHKEKIYSRSRECNRERRKRDPLCATKANVKNEYGITWEDYERMVIEQGGLCACCKKKPEMQKNFKHRFFSIDHDHKTDAVRSLLCQLCNVMLGGARDDQEILAAGIEYLKLHSDPKSATILPFKKESA